MWYEMKDVFRQAGLNVNVDHIVPLDGKLVCGLHTAENMQVITFQENMAKSNKWWPDGPMDEPDTEQLELLL